MDDDTLVTGAQFVEEELPADFWDDNSFNASSFNASSSSVKSANPSGDFENFEETISETTTISETKAVENSSLVRSSPVRKPNAKVKSKQSEQDDEPKLALLKQLFPGKIIRIEALEKGLDLDEDNPENLDPNDIEAMAEADDPRISESSDE